MSEHPRAQRCRKHFESGGLYFNIFPNSLAISESGGVTKSRPIDPFFDVIYLFLNVRFGQKVFKLTIFGCHDLRFECIIYDFLATKSTNWDSTTANTHIMKSLASTTAVLINNPDH